ncbi:S8 family serine peptidase [Microbacterium sp. ZXX196]|uniref:S8 family serine peptidase n=1 Tax=Microbacterium sp. ZXX196 TaxID=2609291 RepID=UPI0012B82186|nr:S8 family serine peptidase [Microbacterium sp. ZXX196]MTE22844.1 S8 family serine peptidase [Microbacterium sp. ZXX196]
MRRAARAIAAACAALAVACAVALPGAAVAAERTPTPTPTEEPDPTRAAEYWLEAYGIEDAWDTARGQGVTIAVIDSGVAADIDELDGAVAGGTDVSGVGAADGRTPLGSDVHTRSHGTWVASLAAARGTGEEEGMIGVAPEADLLAVSLGFGSVSDVPFSDQVADAMRWSVDNGADVINLSFTTNQTQWDESWDDAFQYAYDNDVVVVVAAGNRVSGTTMVGAPATIPGVLTVAGVDPDGRASEDASTQGITIGVSAPSEQLLGISPTGTVEQWSGTSGSAPIVSGIVALVRSAYPRLDAVNVINRIVQTADPAPEQTGERDPLYGFGIVDARAAIEDDVPLVSENPMGSLAEWVRINRAAGSEPEAAVTPTPDPVELPALPAVDGPAEAGSPFLPSAESLRDVTLPLVALSAAGILFVLGVVAVSRRIRSARAQRGPNP